MTTQEIQARIAQVKKNEVANTAKMESLQNERARLALLMADTKKVDKQIEDIRRDITSHPAELRLLEEQLTEAQAQATAKARDELIEKQQSIAEDVEQLSQDFVEALQAAKNINNQLVAATSAYTALKEKTGMETLEAHCQGSQESLSRLLELMEYQMGGIHTATSGPGMVGSNVPILL